MLWYNFCSINWRSIKNQCGFTLIELMITVAIVAILAAIALPSYQNYVIRSKLANAINGLGAMQAAMEQYYQDNRTYQDISATLLAPCNAAVSSRTYGDFIISCSATTPATATTYLLEANPLPTSTSLTGFQYSVNQADTKSTIFGTVWGSTTISGSCWSTSKGSTAC